MAISEERKEEEAQEAKAAPAMAEVAAEAALAPDELQVRLEKLEQEVKDLRDKWMRARADLSNFRRRADQEKEEMRKSGSVLLLVRLLPVMDDLERALQVIPRELLGFTWLDGLIFIQRKLQAILEAEGVREIVTQGVNFDPKLHEAVIYEEDSDHQEGYILGELQRGYLLYDRVLRPALVRVAKGGNALAAAPTPEETRAESPGEGQPQPN